MPSCKVCPFLSRLSRNPCLLDNILYRTANSIEIWQKGLVADSRSQRYKCGDRRDLQKRRSLLFRKERLANELDAVESQWQNTCLLLLNHKPKQMWNSLIGRPILSRREPAQAGWMSFVMMHLSLGWYCDRFFESAILTQTNNTFFSIQPPALLNLLPATSFESWLETRLPTPTWLAAADTDNSHSSSLKFTVNSVPWHHPMASNFFK